MVTDKQNQLNKQKDKSAVGIILSAGYSSRMGMFKPLLPIGDKTAISMVTDALRSANIEKVVGVTGHNRELIKPVFESMNVMEAYNPDYATDMFSSIKRGISFSMDQWKDTVDGFFLMLADSPLIPPEVIRLVKQEHYENPQAFIVPCYKGKKGHPLFIPACYAKEILSSQSDGGLKAIVNKYEDRLLRIEVDEEAVVLDMDTPEGYEEILEFYEKTRIKSNNKDKKEEEKNHWKEALKGRRIFLIRHGQIIQHKDKIFLGQTDIALSEEGKAQAIQAALQLKKMKIFPSKIYSSDLLRALETAEIIKDRLGNNLLKEPKTEKTIKIIKTPDFREMSLGEWDGCLIKEIKERYPDEYRKRGENLISYKYGNDSENFFDLQYRVMKKFKRIVSQEKEKEIVIVAHAGVISVILANLEGKNLEDAIKTPISNGEIAEKIF